MSVIKGKFQRKRKCRITLIADEESVLQFAPNNSIGRQISILLPSLNLLVTTEVYKHTDSL